MLELATQQPGSRVLDVACGTGKQAMRIAARGCTSVGIEASGDMIGLGRWVHPESGAAVARSIAEILPFRDASFDVVMCQGSLDHFADAPSFMREAARVIRGHGRVVIALANYDSLSCRFGRTADRLRWRLGAVRPAHRLWWERPEDHHAFGNLDYVGGLGAGALRMERCEGLSALWNLGPVSWLIEHSPECAARRLWSSLDRAMRLPPQHADMMISIWRKASP
jgi:SAM-dependent methyltransferase